MAGLHMFPVCGAKPEACPTGGTQNLTFHRPGQLEQRRIVVSLGVKCFIWQLSIWSSELQDFRRLRVAHCTENQCEGFRNPEIDWLQRMDLFQHPMWSMRATSSICKKVFFSPGPVPSPSRSILHPLFSLVASVASESADWPTGAVWPLCHRPLGNSQHPICSSSESLPGSRPDCPPAHWLY